MKRHKNPNLLLKIEKALDTTRSYLHADGGDVKLIEVTKGMVVKVELIGACKDCNVSMMTLRNGIEVAIKRAIPDVKKVIEISSS